MKERVYGYYFTLPATIILLCVILVPVIKTVRMSLSANGVPGVTLVQYAKALTDPVVIRALWNTLIISFFSLICFMMIGFAFALFLNRHMRGRTILRVIAILPWTIPDVAVGLVWRWIYNPAYGALNDIVQKIGFSYSTIEWLSSPHLAMISIIIANVWRGYPFVMIILLAGLQSIPKEMYECASIDGAGWFRKTWSITIPGLRSPLIVSAILTFIWEFRRFALVSIMTNGGPGNSTEIMPTLIYKVYFRYFDFEFASAIAILLTILLTLVSIPYIRGLIREA